jgi:hypothetical protein
MSTNADSTKSRDTGSAALRREADGTLTFSPADGSEASKDCRILRSFPWSMPFRYISIRNKEGTELLLIPELADVPDSLRKIVESELETQELIPAIHKIHSVDDTFEVVVWRVDTNSGRVEFQTRHDEDIRLLEGNRIVFRDHRGMLFEIPSLDQLDSKSRLYVEERLA